MSEGLILVPLDGTAAARAALPVAHGLADALHSTLRILHADHQGPMPLADLAARLGADEAVLHGCSIAARAGPPAAVILEEARALAATLIVLCTHTAAKQPPGGLGHVALEVLSNAPCPVVLVPPDRAPRRWAPSRIVLPHDGSPASDAAVAPAATLACLPGTALFVLRVGAQAAQAPDSGSFGLPQYVDQPQHEWPSWADELLGRLGCACADAPMHARLHVRGGDPAAQIVQFAAESSADLIVLSWKGAWGGERARTLSGILQEAPCPVMIVLG